MKEGLFPFGKRNILTYSNAVNLDRSVPELFDGLKTVQRRILWAANTTCPSKGHYVKSARLVGETLGKFHPHGDASLSGALVNMTQAHADIGYMDGSGNWGTLVDPPAAIRYTETKLSDYGNTLLDKDYLAVTNFVPNYDDTSIEPVVLPALLPNVILNGNSGIGVGITTRIPSFTKKSVIKALSLLLSGEKLTAKELAKIIKPNLKFGGIFVNTKENRIAWVKLFKNSESSIQFQSELKVDEKKKKIIVDTWPPGLVPDTLVNKIQVSPLCGSVYNSKGTLEYTILLKKGGTQEDFSKLVKQVEQATTVKANYKINVTHRIAEVKDGVVSFNTEFYSLSASELLIKWLKLRIELEVKSLKHQISKKDEEIANTRLLRYGVSIIDVLTSAIKSKKDPVDYVVKHSKCNREQADYLLHRQIIQLSRLEDSQLKEKLSIQLEEKKHLEKRLKYPKKSVLKQLETLG